MDRESVETVFNNEYFGINKRLQEFSGLWPYKSRFDKILRRCIVIISLSMVAFPNANAVRIWCGVDLALCAENMCGLSYVSMVFSKYVATFLNEKAMRKLYEEVAARWLSINEIEERQIMINYAKLGWLKSVGYFGYMLTIGICFTQIMMMPKVLDYVLPLNESRPGRLIVKGEFGVDPFDYYYEIYFMYCFCGVLSVPVFASVDTTFTAVVHQNLGVFNVVKHRLRLSTKNKFDVKSANEDYSYNTIVSAVKLHEHSLEMIKLIDSTYYIFFFLLIGTTLTLLSCGAITVMENAGDTFDAVRMTLFEIGTAIHLFYFSWSGQLVLNESFSVFPSAYMNEWYQLPTRSKILLKTIMCRCLKPCQITAGGLYVMNFESFGSTMRAAGSYITVLASFRIEEV